MSKMETKKKLPIKEWRIEFVKRLQTIWVRYRNLGEKNKLNRN